MLGYTEGPLQAPAEGRLPVVLSLPAEIDARMAAVSVHVTATHPETGAPMARSAARAFAYRDGESVRLLTQEEAEGLTRTGLERGVVDDTLVGREVAP